MSTACWRDLLENLFGCSSPVERGAFFSETSLFLFAKAGYSTLCLHSYFLSNSNIFFLQKCHNKLTLTSVIRTWRVDTSIHHFHIDHNAPCLPPKILHNYCLLISLEVRRTVVPRRNWKQWLWKIWGGGGKQGVLWSMSKWWMTSWLLEGGSAASEACLKASPLFPLPRLPPLASLAEFFFAHDDFFLLFPPKRSRIPGEPPSHQRCQPLRPRTVKFVPVKLYLTSSLLDQCIAK